VSPFGFGAAVFSVVGALLAFGAGGWVASKIAGMRRAEPAMLHGAPMNQLQGTIALERAEGAHFTIIVPLGT
jgi:hypothetical protein